MADDYSDFSRGSGPVQELAIESNRSTAPQTAHESHHEANHESYYDPFQVPESISIISTVRVLYDYVSQAPEELSVSKGQIIPVIATHEDGWWEGLGAEKSRRRKGLFPSNFTEPAN